MPSARDPPASLPTTTLASRILRRIPGRMDENKDRCTLVVPGFQRHFEDWLKTKQALIDSQPAHSTTTNMKSKDWYKPEDQARFGKPIPSPYPAGGIRVSRSVITHGSTDRGTLLRRVIYPWFTAIKEDHQSLENPDCMSWEELARCHRVQEPRQHRVSKVKDTIAV